MLGAVRPRYDAEKSVEQIAREVLDGRWGNGEERRKRLTQAGYNHAAVQIAVNALVSGNLDVIAREVLDGKWGNNPARSVKLLAAGYNPVEVQRRVNALAGR